MASCSKNNNGRLLVKPDRRHFLSIIGGDAIHLHKLEIPRQFVRFHGDDLSRVVMLKVSTGARWPVEIVRRNGQIWLHKGWGVFAKYYSLVEGFSVVFEYEKIGTSSQFNVIIYDESMMEIRYNIRFDNGDISDSDDEEQIPGENVVIDEADSDSSFKYAHSEAEQRVNQSFTRKKAPTKAEKAKAVYIHSEASSKQPKQATKGIPNLSFPNCPEAKRLTSANQSFQAEISSHNLNCGEDESIRRRSSGICLVTNGDKKRPKSQVPMVEVSCKRKERSPSSSCCPLKKMKKVENFSNVTGKGTTAEEQNGNRNFSDDLIQISSEDELQLPSSSRSHKKKKKQENNRTQSEAKRDNGDFLTAGRKANAVNRAKALYKSENPSFCIVMQPTYVCFTQVVVPANFANKYFTKQRGIISVKSLNGKTWSVGYASVRNRINQKYRHTVIRKGWSKFKKDNHLAVGDVCIFERINQNASKLKVVICRENQIAAMGNSKQLKHKKMSSLKHFTSVNPYFTVKLQKGYLDHKIITIPTKFMAKCKNRSMENAMLQVEKEEWPVKLISHASDKRFKLSAGLSRFVHDNSLKIGDVCVFELINSKTMVFKVSIFRNV